MANAPSEIIESRFEIKRDGQTSYLAYETDGRTWISLLHTEVATAQRGRGIATELAQMALEYAKDNQLTVEIVCPVVFHFLVKHPEYKPLIGKRQHT